jgi:hypothetical protein
MKPFMYKNSFLEFEKITGTVTGASKYSETYIRTVGGGGQIKNGTGYISTPSIRSTSITKQEFWLITESGEERPINITGYDIPIREGQVVTVIHACRAESYIIIVFNHTANRYWTLRTPKDIVKDFPFVRGYGFHVSGLIILPIIFFAAVLAGGTNQMVGVGVIVFELAAFGFLLVDYLRVRSERETVIKALSTYYQNLTDEVASIASRSK